MSLEHVEHLLAAEPDYIAPARDPLLVRAAEERLAVSFPRTTIEWFSRTDATRVLARYSNSDQALELAQMQLVGERVVFMLENQGVCRWAFRLEGDDPAIDVQVDDGPWRSCNCRFSELVAAQVFDWGQGWAEDARTLSGDPVTPQALLWLGEQFRAGPVGGLRIAVAHRFFDDRVRISILDEEWWVKTRTFADMDRLLDMLQPFYTDEQ